MPTVVLLGAGHIACQIAGIGSGICEHLVVFVQALHDVERLFRRVAKARICLPLECGQIIEAGEKVFFTFFFTSVTCSFPEMF